MNPVGADGRRHNRYGYDQPFGQPRLLRIDFHQTPIIQYVGATDIKGVPCGFIIFETSDQIAQQRFEWQWADRVCPPTLASAIWADGQRYILRFQMRRYPIPVSWQPVKNVVGTGPD